MPALIFNEQEIRNAIDCVVQRTFNMDFNWDWPAGVAFYGVCEAYEATGNRAYIDQLKAWVDEQLEDGIPPLTVNAVSLGHSLLSLHQATGEEIYIKKATEMAEFLTHDAIRFADGILQHTVNSAVHTFPEQAWVDTMFMAGYFLLRIGTQIGCAEYIADALRQYHGHEQLLQDDTTNLYYHGWDHRSQSHMSGVFWARGNAWAALTMARALDLVDVQHPSFMIIEGSLRDQLSALARLQDESGLWHTVLNDPNSYLETSASAGIAAAMLTRGRLYNAYVNRSVRGILSRIKNDGTVTGVSAGTAVMHDVQGYKETSHKRIQGWGQGLTLVFLSALLARQQW